MDTTLFHRKVLVLFFILALRSTTTGQDFENVGLMASVTQKTIARFNEVLIDDVRNQIQGKRFSDVNGSNGTVSYSFGDISVSSINGLNSSLSSSDGSSNLDWTANISSINTTSSWNATWKTIGESPAASAHGRIIATAINVHLGMPVSVGALSGALYIDPRSCSLEIGGLHINFDGGGSDLDRFLNVLHYHFDDTLRNNLHGLICQAANGSISKAANDLKNINTTTTIHTLGVPMTLDLGFVSVQIRNSKFSTYHKGSIKYRNKTYQLSSASSVLSAASDPMLSLYMREEMLNNYLKALYDQNLLDGSFSAENVDAKYKEMLAFDCKDQYCIGLLIPKLNDFFPSMNLKMRTKSIVAALKVQPNTLMVRISGLLELVAARPNSTDKLICSGNIDLEVPLQVRFQGLNFTVRASNIWGNLTINSSNIGHILDRDVQSILNYFIWNGKGMIMDVLNKYETSIPIELPKDITFLSASLKLQSGILGLEGDICYKQACSYTGSDTWVGESFNATGRMISVVDITPLDTTPNPRTTHGKIATLQFRKTISVCSGAIRTAIEAIFSAEAVGEKGLADSGISDKECMFRVQTCTGGSDEIRKAANNLLKNITTTIHILGITMTLDLGFVSAQIRNNKITTYHKITIKHRNTTYQSSSASSVFPAISDDAMLSFYMREEVLNNYITALSYKNILDGSFSVENMDPKYRQMLAFDCPDQLCIGMLIPKLNDVFPSMNLKMRTKSIVAALNVQPNNLIVRISGLLDLLAARPNSTDKLICSGNMDLKAPIQVRFQGTSFSVRVSNVWRNVTIDTSNIGRILDKGTQSILNSFISLGKDMITDQLNKYETSIPVKLPLDISFLNASLKLYSGIIGLEADICYKQSCSYNESDMWVGENFNTSQRTISVFDVTPLGTTSDQRNEPVVGGHASGVCDIKSFSVHIALCYVLLILFSYLAL